VDGSTDRAIALLGCATTTNIHPTAQAATDAAAAANGGDVVKAALDNAPKQWLGGGNGNGAAPAGAWGFGNWGKAAAALHIFFFKFHH
jgi:hypothetical protein